MSDKALYGYDLEKVFIDWKRQYGKLNVSPLKTEFFTIPSNSPDRRPLLEILFRILIEQHEYEAEDFTNTLSDKIVEACVNPEKENKKKLKGWRKAVRGDILIVLSKIFPATEIKDKNKTYKGVVLIKPENEEITENSNSGVVLRSDGTTYKERPMIDKSQIKGLVVPKYILVENDPLAFLKKGKDE